MFVPASDLTVDSLYVEARCTVVDAFLGITYKRSMKGKKLKPHTSGSVSAAAIYSARQNSFG